MPATAIAEIYADHHGWLKNWLRRKLGCHEQAADVAHDTFVRLLGQQRQADFHEPRALLTHVAKGLVIDHWRRQAVEQSYLAAIAHLPEPEAPTPETRLLILDSLCRIEAMLQAMPARTREIFLLAQLDDIAYTEIAARLGTSLATVKRHMRSAFIACLTAR